MVPDHLNRHYTKSTTFLEEALCVRVLFTPVNNVILIIIRIAQDPGEVSFRSSICIPSDTEPGAQYNVVVSVCACVHMSFLYGACSTRKMHLYEHRVWLLLVVFNCWGSSCYLHCQHIFNVINSLLIACSVDSKDQGGG